jgi:hypothetical protein
MLLTDIGYSAAEEGYTGGAGRSPSTIRAGEKPSLRRTGAYRPSAPLTRDSAARMVCNALETGHGGVYLPACHRERRAGHRGEGKGDRTPSHHIVPLLSGRYRQRCAYRCFGRFPEHQRGLPRRERERQLHTGLDRIYSSPARVQYVRVFFRLDGKVIG